MSITAAYITIGVLEFLWHVVINVDKLHAFQNARIKALTEEVLRLGAELKPDSRPIEKAQPEMFAVAVTHLDGDDAECNGEKLILDVLEGIDGIQILRLDRTIYARDSKELSDGYQRSQDLLRDSGAHLLIWGKLLRGADRMVPKLYFASPNSSSIYCERYPLKEDLTLSRVLEEDLAKLLRLMIGSRAAEFEAQRGQFVADQLGRFIKQARTLLSGDENRNGWNAVDRAEIRVILGYALTVYGEQTGEWQALNESLTIYTDALKEFTRERNPSEWAKTQGNLGNALLVLGEHELGTERLERAVTAYREALKEFTLFERAPLDWALTQNNLGVLLPHLGERESGTEQLEQAVATFGEALGESNRESVPLQWAMTETISASHCYASANESRVLGG